MHEGLNPSAARTLRQQQVLERLDTGMPVKKIAADMGVTRSAVYQIIERLREGGAVPADFTPSGTPARTATPVLGSAVPAGGPGGARAGGSRLAELRELDADGDGGYAELLAAAIADRDALALAYELGRADAGDRAELSRQMVEAALEELIGLRRPEAAPAGEPS